MENELKRSPEAIEKVEQDLHELEIRSHAIQKLMQLAVSNTLSSDWVDFQGNAWLSTPGAERVARIVGFSVVDWHWEKLDFSDEKGSFYMILSTGRVGLKKFDLWIDALGTCSSRKPFFFMDHGRERHLSEIDLGDIIKDSYSNMVQNGVTRFMGLRGIPWEVLQDYGIEKEKGPKVKFKSKKEKETPVPKEKEPVGQKGITDEEYYALCGLAATKVIGTKPQDFETGFPKNMSRIKYLAYKTYLNNLKKEIEVAEFMKKSEEIESQGTLL